MLSPLLVQEYLRTHSLTQLKAEHGVNFRIHGYKFNLAYDHIEADTANPLACQCRGLVLANILATEDSVVDPDNVIGDTIVMARPMDRFFNLGQVEAAKINFEDKSLALYEKLDGTMIALYWDCISNEWCTGTRSVSEADLPIDGFSEDFTFRKLFEKAIVETSRLSSFRNWLELYSLDKDITYVFELCTPANRIVVDYQNYLVWLIAMRENLTGQEFGLDGPKADIGIPLCPDYRLNSLKDIMEFVSGRDPLKYEGIIVMDENFNRVKIKNAEYLVMSRVKDSAMRSPRALVELCLLGRLDDALPLLPEHVVHRAMEIRQGLREFLNNSEREYLDCLSVARGFEDGRERRKQMALAVKNCRYLSMGYAMARFVGNCDSFESYLKTQQNSAGEYNTNFLESLLSAIDKSLA